MHDLTDDDRARLETEISLLAGEAKTRKIWCEERSGKGRLADMEAGKMVAYGEVLDRLRKLAEQSPGDQGLRERLLRAIEARSVPKGHETVGPGYVITVHDVREAVLAVLSDSTDNQQED